MKIRDLILRNLLGLMPLTLGVLVTLSVIIWVINAQGEVLDVTTVSMTFATEEEAIAAREHLENGGTFADFNQIQTDAFVIRSEPRPRRITPASSRFPEEEWDNVFTRESMGKLIGPYEVRRGWYVGRVIGQTVVNWRTVYDLVYEQTLATAQNRADVLDFALPILLCSFGLLITFTAGLWNIGVEGQVGMGAVGATSIALFVKMPTQTQQIAAELGMAAGAGATWALLVAILKTRGGVNEIFGGVALNFIASNFSAYLLIAPWKPPTSTGSATERFPDYALLPASGEYRMSMITIYIALVTFIFLLLTLMGSKWGLQLKAMGRNARSAEILGISTERNIWIAMALCGALAGLAGAHLVLFRRSNLPANVSGGIGFLALLVVLLASGRVLWVPAIALIFALLYSSGLPLRTRLQLDASLVGVMVGTLVFAVLIFDGVRQRILERWQRQQVEGGG